MTNSSICTRFATAVLTAASLEFAAPAPYTLGKARRTKPMRIHQDLAATIGNTPLSRLKRASETTGCTILGKCAFMNPGQ